MVIPSGIVQVCIKKKKKKKRKKKEKIFASFEKEPEPENNTHIRKREKADEEAPRSVPCNAGSVVGVGVTGWAPAPQPLACSLILLCLILY